MPWMPSAQTTAHGPPEQIEIAGFAKDITVFASKQRPMKMTIYGSTFRYALLPPLSPQLPLGCSN